MGISMGFHGFSMGFHGFFNGFSMGFNGFHGFFYGFSMGCIPLGQPFRKEQRYHEGHQFSGNDGFLERHVQCCSGPWCLQQSECPLAWISFGKDSRLWLRFAATRSLAKPI